MVAIVPRGGFSNDSRQQQPELGLTGLPMAVSDKKVGQRWLDGKDKTILALFNTVREHRHLQLCKQWGAHDLGFHGIRHVIERPIIKGFSSN